MELMILKTVNDNIKEAFVKLEDNDTLTVGFVGKKDNYIFVADDFYDFGTRPIIRFKGNALPKSCGIFLIKDDKAYTMCYSGDLNRIKSTVNKRYTVFDKMEDKTILLSEDSPTEAEQAVHEVEKTEELNSSLESVVHEETLYEKKVEPEYKNTGYALPEDFLAPPEKIPESYWDCNEDKFNGLFTDNPENENLTTLIPGSKWVDVKEEGYVFGVIYDENNSPMYICYGFPLPWGEEPPEKLEGYCQWIPVDCTSPHDDGYWVIYINAKTGERIK